MNPRDTSCYPVDSDSQDLLLSAPSTSSEAIVSADNAIDVNHVSVKAEISLPGTHNHKRTHFGT